MSPPVTCCSRKAQLLPQNVEHVQSRAARTIAPRRFNISILDTGKISSSIPHMLHDNIYEEFAAP